MSDRKGDIMSDERTDVRPAPGKFTAVKARDPATNWNIIDCHGNWAGSLNSEADAKAYAEAMTAGDRCTRGFCLLPKAAGLRWCEKHSAEPPPWEKCQECEEPLTLETAQRVVLGREAFVTRSKRQVAVYYHKPCAELVWPLTQ